MKLNQIICDYKSARRNGKPIIESMKYAFNPSPQRRLIYNLSKRLGAEYPAIPNNFTPSDELPQASLASQALALGLIKEVD